MKAEGRRLKEEVRSKKEDRLLHRKALKEQTPSSSPSMGRKEGNRPSPLPLPLGRGVVNGQWLRVNSQGLRVNSQGSIVKS